MSSLAKPHWTDGVELISSYVDGDIILATVALDNNKTWNAFIYTEEISKRVPGYFTTRETAKLAVETFLK